MAGNARKAAWTYERKKQHSQPGTACQPAGMSVLLHGVLQQPETPHLFSQSTPETLTGLGHWLTGMLVVREFHGSAYGLTLMCAFVAVYGKQRSSTVRITALVCGTVPFMMSMLTVLCPAMATARAGH